MVLKEEPKYSEKTRSSASLFTTNSTWTGLETNSGLILVVGILITVLRLQNEVPSFISTVLFTFPD